MDTLSVGCRNSAGQRKNNSFIRTDTILVFLPLFGRRAGRGGSVEDTSGDEVDGMDETLCPVDYQESGMITDDERFEEVGRPLSLVYAFLS